MILIRNGTSFGLILRLGLIFFLSILSIGLVASLLLKSKCTQQGFHYLFFYSDRLAIISVFDVGNQPLLVWLELTLGARE